MEGAGKLIEDEELREAMAGEGSGHAGHARGHHRRAAGRKVSDPRRPRSDSDREGVPVDDAAARPRRRGIDRARTDRRVGVQAVADGARQAAARRVHAGNRAHDADHRQAREGIRLRHDPRRLRDAANAVPELRRSGEGKLSALRLLRSASSRSRRFRADVSSRFPKSSSCCKDKTIGPLSGFRSKMGRPFSAILKLSLDDEIKNYKLEFDFGQDSGGEDGEPPDFSDQSRSARARSARAACSSTA